MSVDLLNNTVTKWHVGNALREIDGRAMFFRNSALEIHKHRKWLALTISSDHRMSDPLNFSAKIKLFVDGSSANYENAIDGWCPAYPRIPQGHVMPLDFDEVNGTPILHQLRTFSGHVPRNEDGREIFGVLCTSHSAEGQVILGPTEHFVFVFADSNHNLPPRLVVTEIPATDKYYYQLNNVYSYATARRNKFGRRVGGIDALRVESMLTGHETPAFSVLVIKLLLSNSSY